MRVNRSAWLALYLEHHPPGHTDRPALLSLASWATEDGRVTMDPDRWEQLGMDAHPEPLNELLERVERAGWIVADDTPPRGFFLTTP